MVLIYPVRNRKYFQSLNFKEDQKEQDVRLIFRRYRVLNESSFPHIPQEEKVEVTNEKMVGISGTINLSSVSFMTRIYDILCSLDSGIHSIEGSLTNSTLPMLLLLIPQMGK